MRFTVPQFIEHEAKIIGPLTFKQSAYVGTAGIIIFILYYSVPWVIFLPIAIILALGSCALAFLKINGRSLPTFLVNCFNFFLSSKVYLWRKTEIKKQAQRKTNIEIFEKSSNSKPVKVTKTSYLKKIKTKIN